MIKAPSYPAAALAGATTATLLPLGILCVEKYRLGDLSFFVWSILVFVLPAMISTADFSYWKRMIARQHRAPLFRLFAVRYEKEDFSHFLLPAWKRLGVYFASLVFTYVLMLFLLKLFERNT